MKKKVFSKEFNLYTKNHFIILGFFIGCIVSLIGITAEDLSHKIPLTFALSALHHYLTPLILGIVGGIVGYIFGLKNEQRERLMINLTESKNQILLITDNLPSLIAFIDKDLRYRFVNYTYTEWYKLSKEEIYGKHIREIIGNDNFEKVKPGIENALKGQKMSFQSKLYLQDGERYFKTSIIPHFDDSNAVDGFYTLVNDITELKQTEFQLNIQNEELRGVAVDKKQVILNYCTRSEKSFQWHYWLFQILVTRLSEGGDEKSKYFADLLHNITRNTYNILENLLEWADSQRSSIMLRLEEVDFKKIVLEEYSITRSIAEFKGVNITYSIPEIETFLADKQMLRIIIRNLITNAIKFTSNGGDIKVIATKDLGDVIVTVSDNGVGMSEETKSKLFLIDSSKSMIGTAGEKGTGLGLILCKEFVEKHGGKIWVESTLGEGTKFTFTIPLIHLNK